MKIVAVVPIKLKNERLPGKNIKPLGGKPLINYCLETLLKVSGIDETYVYCSDESIVKYLPSGIKFLTRSTVLDTPTANFTQIFSAFMQNVSADIYVYAHATAPFITAGTIQKEIDAVVSGMYDSSFCGEKIQDFLWKDGEALNFDASNIPRSQDLPVIWRETSGVYVFSEKVFLERHRRIGIKPYIVEVSKKEAVDINTYEDFCLAEQLLGWEEKSRNE